jgi:2-polyprenyl-3-methyl-5-hydroxy-6-metoxy-1,4-benzoquinol methylase
MPFVAETPTCPSSIIVYDDELPFDIAALWQPAPIPCRFFRRSPKEALMSSSPPASGSDTTFDSLQFALPYAPGVEKHFWNYARNRIIERVLGRISAKTSRDAKLVLDVGCGPGIVVDYLRRAGIDCRGVELGHPQLRPGLEDYVAIGLDATQLPSALRDQVGAILLLDVVEHIENPSAFLQTLLAAFPHLEHVVITVPARMELWSNYDEFYGHFMRYSRRTLLALAQTVSLKSLELKYIFIGLYPVMWLLSRFVGKRSLESKPPSGLTARIHASIGNAFSIEERLPLVGYVPGTSVIGVFSVSDRPS